MNTTIIYCTDNSLDEDIFNLCFYHLKKFEDDFPIISVSHKPIDLGDNVCVGEQKRSWLTLYRQLAEGLKKTTTKYVAVAEHDCLYADEHFCWRPKNDNIFYYNENVWLVQWAKENHPELKGMYSRYWEKRLALSQLICSKDLLLKSTEAKLKVIDERNIKDIAHAGEPGITKVNNAHRWAKSGRSVYLKKYLLKELEGEMYGTFKTSVPNLDIRHDRNFTGPKRGRHRRYEVKPWGKFENLIKAVDEMRC